MIKLLKVVNRLLILIFICFVFCMLLDFNNINLIKKIIVLCILPLSMVPYLLDKLKVYKTNELVVFFYYIFLLTSMVIGYALDYYYKTWWFDLLSHFISGIFSSIIAIILFEKLKFKSKKYNWFNFFFIIIFSISVAAIWEYLEFFSDKLFGTDNQWVISTGVNDTMTDMLIATLGSILVGLYYLKKNKDGNDVYEKK